MSAVVESSIADGVAVLTLNRPERLNAWTAQMEREYFDLLEECGASAEVRAIVVTGAGRGFCAGADMQDLQGISGTAAGADSSAAADNGAGQKRNGAERAPGQESDGAGRPASERRPQTLPLSIPKPILAAINGPCAGIGLVQALMCDLRFATADAKLTTAFARRGLVAEHGISYVLPRLVGPARALDLLLSGRVVLGSEAAQLGLVNRALPSEALMDEALAYARELAVRCSPASMATMKRQVYADLERPLAEALAEADRLMLESFTRPDFAEGVASFVERRDPSFAPVAG
jgi:enoyl-CoA hydratase/carnithine racemase